MGGGVVAPHHQVVDVVLVAAQLLPQLGQGPVVVEPHHGVEPIVGHILGGVHGDQGIGIGRVAHDQHPNVVGGMVVDGLALGSENFAVGGEQVGALLALAARHGAHQECGIGAVEGFLQFVGDHNVFEQRECGVIQLHGHTLGAAERHRDFQQLQLNGGVFAVHIAVGNAPQQGVGDLASCAGHGNLLDGLGHEISLET